MVFDDDDNAWLNLHFPDKGKNTTLFISSIWDVSKAWKEQSSWVAARIWMQQPGLQITISALF